MHVDSVIINADGSMSISLTEFMNPAQAATFVGATSSVQVTAPGGGAVAVAITLSIAEHEPDKLYAKNKGLLKMSTSQLHDFAATKRKGLPQYAGDKKRFK